jgi:hypothetical protein
MKHLSLLLAIVLIAGCKRHGGTPSTEVANPTEGVDSRHIREGVTEYAQLPQHLNAQPKGARLPLASLDRQHFLSTPNIQRIVVIPSGRWLLSSSGPNGYIEIFKRAFRSSAPIIEPSEELDSMIELQVLGDAAHRSRITWSGVFLLTADGDFLTFGDIAEGFIFYTRNAVGVIVTKNPEQDGGGQPATRPESK